MKLIILAIMLAGCKPQLPIASVSEAKIREIESSKIHIPTEHISWWNKLGPLCNNEFPSKLHKNGKCDDGDATLFNGLICATGVESGCKAVAEAQDDQGRWWRSPRKSALKRDKNSFSRDQTLGVLLYLAATKDKDAANHWMDWMGENRKCLVKIPFTDSCAIGATVTCHDSSNATCMLTPNIWRLFGKVWMHLGIKTSFRMQDPYSELGELKRVFSFFDGKEATRNLTLLEAEVAPIGYSLHLKGVQVFLQDLLGPRTASVQQIADLLHKRQPQNLFFQYLAAGPSQKLADSLIERCPKPDQKPILQNQWAWERADEDRAWEQSMGWDCYFLGRLLIQEQWQLAEEQPN